MKIKKRVKTTRQKLTPQQLEAIKAYRRGEVFPISKCIRECASAINKAESAAKIGAAVWSLPLIKHYTEIADYLLEVIQDNPTLVGIVSAEFVKVVEHGK